MKVSESRRSGAVDARAHFRLRYAGRMKLACWCACLLIAACTSSPPTPEDDLYELNARVATTCRALQDNGDPSPTVDCLNAALQTNTVALAPADYWEGNASECIEHWSFFAADGEVRVFDSIGDCADTDTTTVYEQ